MSKAFKVEERQHMGGNRATMQRVRDLRLIDAGNALKAEIEYDLEERGLIVLTDAPYATITEAGRTLLETLSESQDGFAVVDAEGREVEWFWADKDGEARARAAAAKLNATAETVGIVSCVLCGQTVTSKNPQRYPYCKHCHYVGSAAEHLRAGQMDWFREALAGTGLEVGIEHTGGGCFWLAFRQEGTDVFYIATDGEASLPTVRVEDDGVEVSAGEDERPCRGGWGYVGLDTMDEEGLEFQGEYVEPLHYSEDTLLSDEQVVALIKADLDRRASDPLSRVKADGTFPWATPDAESAARAEASAGRWDAVAEVFIREAGLHDACMNPRKADVLRAAAQVALKVGRSA